jgi:hypothetical protein
LRDLAIFALIGVALAGCASNAAVVQSAPGTYSLSKESTIGGSGLPKLKADVVQEANQYCAKNGREAVLVAASDQRIDQMLTSYVAQIDFRCVATQTMRETAKAAVLECREKRIHQEFKTYKQSAECSNPKILAAYESSDYPYMDLVHVLVDARLVAAENLDKGAITESQAQEQSAELERRLMSEDQKRRATVAASQQVQPPQDPGVYLQGLNAFQATKRAAAKRVQHTALACNAVGFSGGLSTTSCY